MPAPRPLVTVSISSHNYEKFLGLAIESALRQTYERIEVIVVDDGSTDGSRALIAGFGERIRSVFQENQGITAACNTGFAASRGDIVLFLDADDLLEPTAIEEIVACWRPGTIKVQFALEIVDGAGRSRGAVSPVYPSGYSAEALHDEFFATGAYVWPTTSGNAYARNFLERILPLDVRMFPYAPDGAINTIAPLFGRIECLPKVLGSYRIHGANHWALDTVVPAKFGDYINQKEKELAFLRRHAAARGVDFPAIDRARHALTFLEYRLAALKLRQQHAWSGSDRARHLCWAALGAIWRAEGSLSRRSFLLAWFLMLAAARGRLARKLIDLRYTAAARPAFVNRMLAALKILHRPKPGARYAAS
jgi:glycosyltransferase involved in cell wall biosynthesis